MIGEGSMEQQDFQQILDNLVKEEEEKGNRNVSSTTTTITIWDDISNALDEWLRSISILEERQRKVNDLQERINRILQQVQQDGLISIYYFGTLTYIGRVWIDLLNLVACYNIGTIMSKDTKRLIVQHLMQLYNCLLYTSDAADE